ncbi:MAG: uracil-DNA glycosylase [Acidobacteria bacterium]|nr:uracil-DNA glycosylase [Acidobacteriota bacterium]
MNKVSPPHASALARLQQQVIECRACPRLVTWRERVAREKTQRYRDWSYWGKPVPSFGDPDARLLIVGLAPAAHGGNRTGRVFTGDRSGDWLYRALYKFGFANQPASVHHDDGLQLSDCYITAALHCAPPDNKPSAEEIMNCRPFLLHELELLSKIQVTLALGRIAFDAALTAFQQLGWVSLPWRPKFGHGVECRLNERLTLIASFHPSQQNTFTGRLTEPMFDAVFSRIRGWLDTTEVEQTPVCPCCIPAYNQVKYPLD